MNSTTPPLAFSDISGHWAQGFIGGLANQNLVNGFADGTYRPNVAISRAEYAALLVQVLNPQPQKPATLFRDVPVNFWAANAIQLAYRDGFLSGYPDGSFQPNEILLRVQILLSLANGLALPPANLQALNIFDDRNTIPLYAREAVAAATARKLVVSYPQIRQLNPNGQATRADATAMLYQVLVDAKRLPQINSPYIVNS
uniref:S-layer homology domain-containing protein n=1 Tax=Desertifilum tharense IPPAS B-1220 TaxID=1781255 RepID=A0ACD5GP84_9CYAN